MIDKTWAADLYLIYIQTRAEDKHLYTVSDKYQMRMFYLTYRVHTSTVTVQVYQQS